MASEHVAARGSANTLFTSDSDEMEQQAWLGTSGDLVQPPRRRRRKRQRSASPLDRHFEVILPTEQLPAYDPPSPQSPTAQSKADMPVSSSTTLAVRRQASQLMKPLTCWVVPRLCGRTCRRKCRRRFALLLIRRGRSGKYRRHLYRFGAPSVYVWSLAVAHLPCIF